MMVRPTAALLVAGLLGAGFSSAEDAPLQAGRDVPPPAVRKLVEPTYPPAAHEAGLGGIVIVEIVIDEEGKVVSAQAVRSIPGLDEAALDAVGQWEYEVTRVDGKPVKVRHVVPITFSRRLPNMRRQRGIPELRQGSSPQIVPVQGAGGPDSVPAAVEVTLAEDGSVANVTRTGRTSPWLESLMAAVRDWRFTPGAADERVSFRVIANFVYRGEGSPRVDIELTGLRVSSVEPPRATPPPEGMEETATEEISKPSSETVPTAEARGTEQPESTDSASIEPEPDTEPSDDATAQPEVEVIAAPPPPPIVPMTEPAIPGTSLVANVTLGVGVPDLVSGRQPIVPPFARIDKVTGTATVAFGVDASGRARVQGSEGSKRLTPQAEGAVGSWVFQRTTTDRLFLVAEFDYGENDASASVELRSLVEPRPPQPEQDAPTHDLQSKALANQDE